MKNERFTKECFMLPVVFMAPELSHTTIFTRRSSIDINCTTRDRFPTFSAKKKEKFMETVIYTEVSLVDVFIHLTFMALQHLVISTEL